MWECDERVLWAGLVRERLEGREDVLCLCVLCYEGQQRQDGELGGSVVRTQGRQRVRFCFISSTRRSGVLNRWALNRPFVLLAGTTVALLLMIAGSVGLLYSIGGQELPTVLTGGIAGGQKRE